MAVGVARKVNPIAYMVCADTESREIDRPEVIGHFFQVIADASEPTMGAGNLLTKYCSRPSCRDKPSPFRPPVGFSVASSSGATVGLARTTSGPYAAVICPPGLTQGITPDPNASKEVALPVSHKVICSDFRNGAFINIPWCDMSGGNEIP